MMLPRIFLLVSYILSISSKAPGPAATDLSDCGVAVGHAADCAERTALRYRHDGLGDWVLGSTVASMAPAGQADTPVSVFSHPGGSP